MQAWLLPLNKLWIGLLALFWADLCITGSLSVVNWSIRITVSLWDKGGAEKGNHRDKKGPLKDWRWKERDKLGRIKWRSRISRGGVRDCSKKEMSGIASWVWYVWLCMSSHANERHNDPFEVFRQIGCHDLCQTYVVHCMSRGRGCDNSKNCYISCKLPSKHAFAGLYTSIKLPQGPSCPC